MDDTKIRTDAAHGNRGGAALHSPATRDVAGFMSAADKATLDRWNSAPVTKTTSFTVSSTDAWLICNGSGTITVTLPSPASNAGRVLEFKTLVAQAVSSASSNVVGITGGAAATSILPATAGAWATLKSDGSNWIIMRKG